MSRRMPALLTTPSRRPKWSVAVLTILLAGIASATDSKFGTAMPPRFLISSTTSSAGVALEPAPSAAPPGSLTTTLAPSAAQSSAISRPMPRPAPVTMMTLSCSDFAMWFLLLCPSFRGARSANPESRDSGSGPSDHPGMTIKRRSIQQLHIIGRLRRGLDRDCLDGAAVGLGAAMRRALGDDDEVARLHPHFLVAEPDRAGAVEDVLNLVGVGV